MSTDGGILKWQDNRKNALTLPIAKDSSTGARNRDGQLRIIKGRPSKLPHKPTRACFTVEGP